MKMPQTEQWAPAVCPAFVQVGAIGEVAIIWCSFFSIARVSVSPHSHSRVSSPSEEQVASVFTLQSE